MRLSLSIATAAAGAVFADPMLHAESLAKRAVIDDCLKDAKVPVDTVGSQGWQQNVAPFNMRLQYTPVAIAVPSTIAHIEDAVKCAVKAGVKVSPKGGGHSYASFGLGGENGHLVVELDRMSKITVDSTTQIASVEAGSRLGHVFTQLYQQGKRAISHGTCPGVGVAGHALHGGFGFSSHAKGLALDWMVGATVVLANGTAVETSATENPDLLWALRGAGSSFGIVAVFRFKTFAAPSTVTVFQSNLPWNGGAATAAGWAKLQDWVQNSMPSEMNFRIFGSSFQTQMQGSYHGTASDLRSAIQPLLSQLGASLSMVQQTDWVGGFTAYTNGDTVDATHPYNMHETFFSKSLVTTALPAAALQAASNYWMTQAAANSRSWYIIIDMYGGKNAYISNQPANESSFAHRDKLFLYEFYDRVSFGSYPVGGESFLNNWVKSFTDNLKDDQWGMYINYADPTLSKADAQKFYWRNSLPRLQKIKAQLDPTEVFYYPQSITPAK